MARLKKNQSLKTISNEKIKIVDVLGEGGQGIVYKVIYKNKDFALKWYSKGAGKNSERFYQNILSNINKGSPASTFLWPIDITEKDENGSFGYIMELRSSEYKDFSSFLLNKVHFNSFTAIVNAGMQMTASFRMLHNRGFSYQDFNDGNFFINPSNGDLLICDNDNVAPYKENLGIQGKPRYMAPEIVSLSKKPDSFSDRFSLAVVLFLLLFRAHPLTGKADNSKTDPAKNEMNLYCKNPVFIFDPDDDSNRPDPEIHKNALLFWSVYPEQIKNEFIKAFNKSLMSSDGTGREDRIIEKEWLKKFTELKTQIVTCPVCGEETFIDSEQVECKCINCDNKFIKPPVLHLEKYKVPLQPERKMYIYEVEDDDITVESLSQEICEIITNKNNPNIWGLKNISNTTWIKTTPSGKTEEIPSNGVVPVARGVKIKLSQNCEGIIE